MVSQHMKHGTGRSITRHEVEGAGILGRMTKDQDKVLGEHDVIIRARLKTHPSSQ